jgi:dihydrofolate reductase
MSASLTLVVATDRKGGIGINNTLPWRLPEDLAFFKRTTSGHTIIMGRKTFESIGRPLPNRRNIVVTRNPAWQHAGVEAVLALSDAIALAGEGECFVIGGGQIYAAALPLASRLIITEIDAEFDCDAHFPEFDRSQWAALSIEPHHSESNGFDYAFAIYHRK